MDCVPWEPELATILVFNGLAGARVRTREAWSGIDVQTRRRADLVPALVETVKGYAAHEREVLDEVVRARTAVGQTTGASAAAGADGELARAIGRLFAVAESYPALRASENFRALQEELADIEEKVAYARRFYNRNAAAYNARIATFPGSLVAGAVGFEPVEFFEAGEGGRALPVVSFAPPARERSA
jgi:LemA protein